MDISETNDRTRIRTPRTELSRATTTVVSFPSTISEERPPNGREHQWSTREERVEPRARAPRATTTADQEALARRFEEERVRLDRQRDLERLERPSRQSPSQVPEGTLTGQRLMRILHMLEVDPNNQEGLALQPRLRRVFGLAILVAKREAGEAALPDAIWNCMVGNLIESQLAESEIGVTSLWRTVLDTGVNHRRLFDQIVEGDLEHTHREVDRWILSGVRH